MDHRALAAPKEPKEAMAGALRECRKAIWAVALFSLVINMMMLVPAVFMLQVYDRVLSTGREETLILLAIVVCLGLVLLGVLDALRGIVAARVAEWLSGRLGPLAVATGIEGGLKGDTSGANALRDIGQVQGFIGSPQASFFFDAPWVPIFVFIIWLMHPALGLVALAGALVLGTLAFLNDVVTRGPSREAQAIQARSQQQCTAAVRNAEAIRAMGMLPQIIARWDDLNVESQRHLRAAGERSAVIVGVTKSFRMIVQIAILAVGAWYVLAGQLTAGGMIAASILLGRALQPVEQAIGAWRSFTNARMALQRLRERIEKTPVHAARERTRLPAPRGPLALQNATVLSPTTRAPIIRDITFTLEPGEALAVVGPSASGKSTLCRVLVGIMAPNFGSVRLDGSEIGHWDPEQLGEVVGYLPQDPSLFPGTVHENIARLRPLPDETVVEAAMMAEAHDLIRTLPDAYETHVGESGAGLSGGQRQRVGLARAVCGQPRLVVLDEPNANLDQAGEAALSAAIKTLKASGAILVIVGHRPSTLNEVDKVLVLNGGHMQMLGPREEVLDKMRRNQAQRSPRREVAEVGAAEDAGEREGAARLPARGR